MSATITLECERGTWKWNNLRELLAYSNTDLRREMNDDADVCIFCDVKHHHQPSEPDVGIVGGPVVEGVTWKDEHYVVYDMSQFFTNDQLMKAAVADEQADRDAAVDMEIDAARDRAMSEDDDGDVYDSFYGP